MCCPRVSCKCVTEVCQATQVKLLMGWCLQRVQHAEPVTPVLCIVSGVVSQYAELRYMHITLYSTPWTVCCDACRCGIIRG